MLIPMYAELLKIKGRIVVLEMPARGHRGRGGRGGQGGQGGKHGGHRGSTQDKTHVALPALKTLPPSLTINPCTSDVPQVIKDSLPEFSDCQPYWSALEKLMPEFAGSPSMYKKCWTGISGELWKGITVDETSRFHATVDLSGVTLPVFIKRIHLLDATSAMEGAYVWPKDGALPAPSELWKAALAKINDPLNEAYVDALFALCVSRLVKSGISPHWCGCLGTFSARVDRYLYNVTDEYESLRQSPWWKRNQQIGLFHLAKTELDTDHEESEQARFFSEGISMIDDGDFEVVEDISSKKEVEDDEVSEIEPLQSNDTPVQLNKPSLRIQRMKNTSDDEDSDDYSSTSEIQQYVEFNQFPVQVTFLERAEGTMDELMDAEDETDPVLASTKEDRWSAWLFQVIAALTCAQHYFGFVHNDLHTNNIMWSGTGITHIYYRVIKNKVATIMKVPTYGRIMKIIDFGRATYTLPDPAGFIISDAFYPGNDAGTQYNCEPFYDDDEKKVEPNPSFDLARLGVSILEALYPERPETAKPVKVLSKEGSKLYSKTVSDVYNVIWSWMIDDEGKSVLRKPDGEERYPDFDLYRALAATVHNAIPKKQIELEMFQKYKVQDKHVHIDGPVYDLNI